jgi:hypothetical protein
MKLANDYLVLLLCAVPFLPVTGKSFVKNAVVITPSEVDGANDIEAVILRGTENGILPGMVILDGGEMGLSCSLWMINP